LLPAMPPLCTTSSPLSSPKQSTARIAETQMLGHTSSLSSRDLMKVSLMPTHLQTSFWMLCTLSTNESSSKSFPAKLSVSQPSSSNGSSMYRGRGYRRWNDGIKDMDRLMHHVTGDYFSFS
jgi:hypothetical protein